MVGDRYYITAWPTAILLDEHGRVLSRDVGKLYGDNLSATLGDLFNIKLNEWSPEATGQTLEIYTVITTDPNELMEPIHNRMPVMLQRQDYER